MIRCLHQMKQHQRHAAVRHEFCPSLEALEDRCLLSGAAYSQINLVADTSGAAAMTDAHLVDPWGLAIGPDGSFLVADHGSGVATVYAFNGQPVIANGQPEVITVATDSTGKPLSNSGKPTGAVYNSFQSGPFAISRTTGGTTLSASSRFLVATDNGIIAGWNPAVDLNNAIVAVNNSATGASYTGLAEATGGNGQPLLFAADYHNAQIDVFDSSFHATLVGVFADSHVPAGFAPFDVQNIGGKIYVTYAKQNFAEAAGNGFVDVFDTSGNLLHRLTSSGPLDLPWGLALAPASFGQFANDLLVGNFGNGRVNVFDPNTGVFVGQLHNSQDDAVSNSGLWSLQFGQGGQQNIAGSPNALYFTAGPGGGQHGLFGTLQLIPGVFTQTLSTATGGGQTVSYAITTGSSLFQHTNAGGWTKLGDNVQSVSAVVESSGNVVVFAQTRDHGLFRFTSSGWQQLGAPGTILSISAGTDVNGVADVYVITADTSLTEFRDASGWLGSNLGGAGSILQMSATANDRLITVSTDGSVFEHDQTFGWFALSSAGFANQVSAVTDLSGNLVVFAVTGDKSMVRYDMATGWSVQGGSGTVETAGGGIDAAGAVDVYLLTSAGAFSELNNQFGFRQLGAPGSIRYFNPAGQDRVFVVTADQSVAEFDGAVGWLTLTSPGFAKG